MRKFLGSYRYRGAEWCFEVIAEGPADAETRLQAIQQSGRIDGELRAEVSLVPLLAFVAGLVGGCWGFALGRAF